MVIKKDKDALPEHMSMNLPWEEIGREVIVTDKRYLKEIVADVAEKLDFLRPEINGITISNSIGQSSIKSDTVKAMRAVLESVEKNIFTYRIEGVF